MDRTMWDAPEEWSPSRFSEDSNNMDLQKTMAFGSGKRVCAGSLQAMLITCTAIGRFVQEFKWELKDGQEADVDTVKLSNMMQQPMHAYIKHRNTPA